MLCRTLSQCIYFIAAFWLSASVASAAEKPPSNPPYCGIYCLYAAALDQGREMDFDRLLQPRFVGCSQGSTIAELSEAAKAIGMYTAPLNSISTTFLKNCRKPVILNVKDDQGSETYNHWILFVGNVGGQARIIDGGRPMQKVSFEVLALRSNGIGLVVSGAPITRWTLISSTVAKVVAYVALFLSILFAIRVVIWPNISQLWEMISVRSSAPLQSAALVIGAVAIAVTYHLVAPTGLLGSNDTVEAIREAQLDSNLSKVNVAYVERASGDHTALLVDARGPADFSAGHIENALNIPADLPPGLFAKQIAAADRRSPVIVYCQSLTCPYAAVMAKRLQMNGFASVAVYPDGWQGWLAAGHSEHKAGSARQGGM